MNIPKHLESTIKMLKSAFPDEIPVELYLPLLAVLYDEMSDRNLAEVISLVYSKDNAVVMNDIYKVANFDDKSQLKLVVDKLKPYGYDDWLKEE